MKTNTNQEFSAANASSAGYTPLVTVGVLQNAGRNLTDIVTATTGSVFVAQSPPSALKRVRTPSAATPWPG